MAAAQAGAPGGEGPFPFCCTKCGACSANCTVIVTTRHGVKHAFACTYDGYGCAETGAGERVHLTQFKERWPEVSTYDLELRFTPAAAEIFCMPSAAGPLPWAGAAHSRSCAPKGLQPQRSLRALRETLTACKDVQAAGEKAAALAAAAAASKPAKPAPAPATAAVLVTKATASEEAMPGKAGRRATLPPLGAAGGGAPKAPSPNTRGAKRAGEALLPGPAAAAAGAAPAAVAAAVAAAAAAAATAGAAAARKKGKAK